MLNVHAMPSLIVSLALTDMLDLLLNNWVHLLHFIVLRRGWFRLYLLVQMGFSLLMYVCTVHHVGHTIGSS